MRLWDGMTAHGVDHFIANSDFIARRIAKTYRRDARVIYPPVDTRAFSLKEEKQPFFLTASRMVPYKRVPLIVEAFAALPEHKLVVISDGPEYEKAKALAAPNIELLGFQPTAVLRTYMQDAKAFVFAAEEDFGITPVEAQACGTPVIALGKGGARETIQDLATSERPTGVFFADQTVECIRDAVCHFEANRERFAAAACRANAERFSIERFVGEIRTFVQEAWAAHESARRLLPRAGE
jgi:glycosyltransferase involved in cell wall biosynthesis